MIAFAKLYYFIFAALTAVGGVMGYLKAGSVASVVAGVVSGILLAVGAWLIPSQQKIGLALCIVVSLLLAGRFLPVFLKTKAMMPAGLMAVLGIIGLIVGIIALIKR